MSCLNGSRETVLGRTAEEILKEEHHLSNAGFKCTQLKVPFAFHSDQVEPILDDFEQLAASVRFSKERIPIISSLHGRVLSEHVDVTYLRNHARDRIVIYLQW